MIKNLIKQTLRGLSRDKFHSLINIFGLGLGIACCLIGLLFVQSELSYDRHHENHERIYHYGVQMTIGGVTSIQSSCNPGAGPLLKDFIPEIESFVRIGYLGEILVKQKDRAFSRGATILWADPSMFNVFSHTFRVWKSKGRLEPGQHHGADPDHVQKNIRRQEPDRRSAGDRESGPLRSHRRGGRSSRQRPAAVFRPAFLLHPVQRPQPGGAFPTVQSCPGTWATICIFFSPRDSRPLISTDKARQFYQKYQAATRRHPLPVAGGAPDRRSPAILIDSEQAAANSRFLFWFCGIVLLIMFLAGVNYVNLTTSRAGKRAKEIGVKKVSGSSHGQLVRSSAGRVALFRLPGPAGRDRPGARHSVPDPAEPGDREKTGR